MFHKYVGRSPLLLGVSVLLAAVSDAQEPANSKAKPAGDGGPIVARETVKVEKGRLTSSLTVKSTVEGENRTEIKVRLKVWANPLVVEQAAPHGAKVRKGDSLLKFDLEKIEQQLRITREDRESAALAIRLAEHELPLLKQQLPLDLQASERQKKQSGEDLQRFLQVDKAHDIEAAEFALRNAEFNVEYSRDELEQLEKMYRDKDLTEETERMILKRYKFNLARAELMLRSSRLTTEQTLKVTLPRREEDVKMAAAKAEISWEKAREELPVHVRQKELALDKMRYDERRAKERLSELEQDLKELTVASPANGVVYHGRYYRGQWSGPPALSYLKGGTLPANDVVLTIISTGKLFLYADLDEKEIGDVKVGQAARFSPTMAPQRKLNGTVHRVVPVPQGGKYEILIAITDDVPDSIVPGMTGSARITTYQNDGTLSVPSTAVFEDTDREEFYVYLPGEKPQKKVVKTGQVTGGKTEILEGLKDGDEILAAKP